MVPTIERISAITLRVLNMEASVQFYRNVLGMELLHGRERASFSSLRAKDSESVILNLEQGDSVPQWGRLIFHVTGVDAFWAHLREKDLILKSHVTRLGVSAISTCSIPMATSCRLLGRYNEWTGRACPNTVCIVVTVEQRHHSELCADHRQAKSSQFGIGEGWATNQTSHLYRAWAVFEAMPQPHSGAPDSVLA
jgi:catechol 2,3-dioxygenase-like lactoylglutathione lyase family enzyme